MDSEMIWDILKFQNCQSEAASSLKSDKASQVTSKFGLLSKTLPDLAVPDSGSSKAS